MLVMIEEECSGNAIGGGRSGVSRQEEEEVLATY